MDGGRSPIRLCCRSREVSESSDREPRGDDAVECEDVHRTSGCVSAWASKAIREPAESRGAICDSRHGIEARRAKTRSWRGLALREPGPARWWAGGVPPTPR
jgi:hypothetical protein